MLIGCFRSSFSISFTGFYLLPFLLTYFCETVSIFDLISILDALVCNTEPLTFISDLSVNDLVSVTDFSASTF